MKRMTYPLKSTIFTLLLILCLSHAQAFAGQTIEGSIDDLARALMTYFPKVSGKVTAIHNSQLEVDLGPGQGLAAGVLLTVFREGETFHHPVTNVPLGRFEGEVGAIEVLQFKAPHLKANRINTTKKIEVGDLVRLPSTKITLGIAMRSETDHAFVMNELSIALRETNRFQIETLATGSDVETASRSGNDYYITLKTVQEGKQVSANLLLQNTATGKQLAELDLLIRQSKKSDLILEHLQYQLFEQRLKKSTP